MVHSVTFKFPTFFLKSPKTIKEEKAEAEIEARKEAAEQKHKLKANKDQIKSEKPSKTDRDSKKKENKNKRKSSSIKSLAQRDQSTHNPPPKKIPKTNISNDTIYTELDWFDHVPEEIASLNDDYINQSIIELNQNLQVNPRIFSEKMTAVLRAPPSLDSETRTWLTNLPAELADPSKIDKIVEVGLGGVVGFTQLECITKHIMCCT